MRVREREWVWESRGNQPLIIIASNSIWIVTHKPQLTSLLAATSAQLTQQNYYTEDAELVLLHPIQTHEPSCCL